jgi:hypothetical protein
MNSASIVVSVFSLFVAVASFGVAYFSLQTTRGLNRAKFLYDLHKDFFVEETYKATLDVIDEPSGDQRIVNLVKAEDSCLIELLNAFELVAYFEYTKQLTYEDADALLDYYLGCILRHAELRDYINDDSKSFGYLKKLLVKRSQD